MILEPKKTNVAYRCAECGSTVYGIAGAAALSGDMIKLKCSCGKSEIEIKNIGEGKLRITLPCVFCQKSHTFVISKKLLFSRELFTYPCQYTGVDICFFGSDECIREAVSESDEFLSSLLTEEQKEAFLSFGKQESIQVDEHKRDLIILTLGELAEDHSIICDCGKDGEFLCEAREDYVELSCKKCNCSRRFYTDSSLDTEDLFYADTVRLYSSSEEDDV